MDITANDNLQQVKDFLIDKSVVIIMVTVFSFLGCYYYEAGYCSFFQIPKDLISIDLKNYGSYFFKFLLVLLVGFFLNYGYYIMFFDFTKFKNRFVKLLHVLFYFGWIAYILFSFLRDIYGAELKAMAGCATLSGVIYFLGKSDSLKESKFYAAYYRLKADILCKLLVFFSWASIILFAYGYISARDEDSFYFKSDNNSVLLRKYGDISIFGLLKNDSVSAIYFTKETGDTLHISKLHRSR